MEQTKNEPKNENKAAPDNGKPKKERKPLTEAQRLKRQKMIVLPAIVLVFIGYYGCYASEFFPENE